MSSATSLHSIVPSPTSGTGTLLIQVTHKERQVIKMVLDREQGRIIIYKNQHDGQPVALTDIVGIKCGADADVSPDDFGLDKSVEPLWFTLSYKIGEGNKEHLRLLALGPEVPQAWSTAVSSAPGNVMPIWPKPSSSDKPFQVGKGFERRSSTDATRSFFGNSAKEIVTTSTQPSANAEHLEVTAQYWTDWPFMIDISQLTAWDLASVNSMAVIMGNIASLEQNMAPLESKESGFWKEYVQATGTPLNPLEHDELLKAYGNVKANLNVSAVEKEQRLSILQQLNELRYQKAWGLDHLGLEWKKLPPPSPMGPRTVTQSPNLGSRFWAILVGINEYDHHNVNNLNGCVADVKLMAEFLSTSLRIPEAHILVLTSPSDSEIKGTFRGSPTRENILDALYSHFRDNTEVQHGDNLFFHFSGHGASYKAVKAYGSSFTETICPKDRGQQQGDTTVCDISDRELNTIVSEISKAKGSNITVVIDSCHSGGAMKASTAVFQAGVRSTYPLDKPDAVKCMFELAEQDLRRSSGRRLTDPEWSGDMTTHVLLAACAPHELAKETDAPQGGKIGAATFAIVSALGSPRGMDPTTTYIRLVTEIIQPPPMQTLTLAGGQRGARLWFQDAVVPA